MYIYIRCIAYMHTRGDFGRLWALQAASSSLVSSVRERFSQFRDVALKRKCSDGGPENVFRDFQFRDFEYRTTINTRAGSASLNMRPLICLPCASVSVETCSTIPRRQLLVSHVFCEAKEAGVNLLRFPSCGTRVGACATAQRVWVTLLYLLPWLAQLILRSWFQVLLCGYALLNRTSRLKPQGQADRCCEQGL